MVNDPETEKDETASKAADAGGTTKGGDAAAARRKREAEALRANLKRRKAQQRARREALETPDKTDG
ncbi:MAG: hypothetical protein ACTS3R_09485 [Inquilinaceae bacterium]